MEARGHQEVPASVGVEINRCSVEIITRQLSAFQVFQALISSPRVVAS
jgi:hypothetical protein